jgi:hypothetical protein
MKKIIALAAAAVFGFAAFAASAQPYAAPPSDNLLFAQAQAPQDAPTAKAKKAAKAKKKSDSKTKAAATSKKGGAKKADAKKTAKKKAATKKTGLQPPS